MVRKAVIPAAGLGTRFLPATKAQPKEMLPLIDKPVIQFVIEEAIAAELTNILVITGKGKRAIEDHFDRSFELERTLEEQGKLDLLEEVRRISSMARIYYTRQPEPKGLGDAVYCAKQHVGEESFAVLLGDDVIFSQEPCIKQLVRLHEELEAPVLAVQEVPLEAVQSYGVIKGTEIADPLYEVEDLVEKPKPEDAPSRLAIVGRYVLIPQIFEAIKRTKPGVGGEIQLTDALRVLRKSEKIYACKVEGERYDMGNKRDFLRATVEYALRREEFRVWFSHYLITLASKLK